MSRRPRPPLSLLLALAGGCELPPPPADAPADTDAAPDPEVAECTQRRADVQGLLRERCAGCHDDGRRSSGRGRSPGGRGSSATR